MVFWQEKGSNLKIPGYDVLKISKLNFAYNSNIILKNIFLEFNEGEFSAIIGPNGAGKSTLLKIIDGILHSDDEHVTFDETAIKSISRKQLARNIAYLPQEIEFSFAYSVHDVVRMGRFPYLHGLNLYSQDDEMDIEQFKKRSFNELSGGEKQRVLIASALAQQPKIILLDEPTSALDLHHQIAIYQILKSLQKEKNLTVIVVTHDINLVAQFSNRIILMDKGSIIKDGTPEEVLKFKTLQDTFGVKVYIDINPITKSLYILPYE